MTTGEELKKRLGLTKIPARINRVVTSSIPMYYIWYDTNNYRRPITDHLIRQRPWVSLLVQGSDLDSSVRMTPLTDLELFNGRLEGAYFITIDLSGHQLIKTDKLTKVIESSSTVSYEPNMFSLTEDGYSVSDLFSSIKNQHEIDFYQDRLENGSHGLSLKDLSWSDRNTRAVGVDRYTSTLTLTFAVIPTYEKPKFVFSKQGHQRPGRYYTVKVQFQEINNWIESRKAFTDLSIPDQQEFLEQMFEVAPVKIWSNDPSWMYRGSYENASDLGYSLYDFHVQGIPKQQPDKANSAYKKYYEPHGSAAPAIFTLSKHMIEVLQTLPSMANEIVLALTAKYGESE